MNERTDDQGESMTGELYLHIDLNPHLSMYSKKKNGDEIPHPEGSHRNK